MTHSNDLFQLLLSGSSVTLVPTTANRLPMEPYSVLMEQLWAKGIDISAFLIPEQELADLYRKNPSWRPNDIEIARNDLDSQLRKEKGEVVDLKTTDEEGGDDGGGHEARFEPKESHKTPRVSVLDEIEQQQKPRPKPAPSAQEALIEQIKRRIGSKPHTHDEGRELEMD